jgi:hypothetical protein
MRKHDPDLAAKLRWSYDAGLGYKHKCGQDAYPLTLIGDDIIWECLDHGFIEAREVTKGPPRQSLVDR